MDKQRLTRNATFSGLCIAGVGLAIGYGNHLLHSDPFSRFSHNAPPPQSILAKLNNVDIVQYHKDQLVGSAHVGELDIRQDQQTYDLSKVYNGVLATDQGVVKFNADSATWDAGRLYLTVNSGAQVANKDFDLTVPSFTLDQSSGMLSVPREIRGRFFGGEITAKKFLYNVNTKDGSVGPAMWTGKPNLQDEGTDNNTKWTFNANGAVFSHNGIETWHNATATDGDVIVQAPVIERNKKTDVITATGGCLYWSKKADMACDQVVVYRQEKRAVLTGNVRMLVKPKDEMEKEVKADTGEIPVFHPEVPGSVVASNPAQGESQEDKDLDDEVRSGKTTRKYPSVILSNEVEYWYAKGNRHANITGSPQASQILANGRWRKVWATSGYYDGEKDTILLKRGDKQEVEMKDSIGDDILATDFLFSTQEDNEDWSGDGMHGYVIGEGTDDTDKSGAPTPTTGTGGVNPPPPTTGGQGGNGKPPVATPVKPANQQKKPA